MGKPEVNINRTDQRYWDAQLESFNLGMNRGTSFPAEDLADNEELRKASKPKNKGGRPRKPGPRGPHLSLTKPEAIEATRSTATPDALGGLFRFQGFRQIGARLVGAGRGQKGGRKGPEGGRDDRHQSGHFLQYIGGSDDLSRLEERISRDESGRVRAAGNGPDR